MNGPISMKICVIGCGAVGSLFAAHLAKAGEAEVWAYDVWKEHTDAIQQNGLRLSGAADFTARLNATSDAQSIAALRLRHRRHEGDPHSRRHRSGSTHLRRPQRGLFGAERCRKRRNHRRACEVRDSRHHVSRRASDRTRTHRFRHPRRHLDRAVRAHQHSDGQRSKNLPA